MALDTPQCALPPIHSPCATRHVALDTHPCKHRHHIATAVSMHNFERRLAVVHERSKRRRLSVPACIAQDVQSEAIRGHPRHSKVLERSMRRRLRT